MRDLLTTWIVWTWSSVCGPAAGSASGHHGIAGPVLGNMVVAGAAVIVTLFCFVAAVRFLIHPGERDPRHPKYRILRGDR